MRRSDVGYFRCLIMRFRCLSVGDGERASDLRGNGKGAWDRSHGAASCRSFRDPISRVTSALATRLDKLLSHSNPQKSEIKPFRYQSNLSAPEMARKQIVHKTVCLEAPLSLNPYASDSIGPSVWCRNTNSTNAIPLADGMATIAAQCSSRIFCWAGNRSVNVMTHAKIASAANKGTARIANQKAIGELARSPPFCCGFC